MLDRILSIHYTLELTRRQTWGIYKNLCQTVEIIQGVIGRIFGFGTVKVTGRGISDLVFKNISDPMDVKKKIESVGAT
jgi:uncharacterized membrane protein YdbT with pleckstrin-like domain